MCDMMLSVRYYAGSTIKSTFMFNAVDQTETISMNNFLHGYFCIQTCLDWCFIKDTTI